MQNAVPDHTSAFDEPVAQYEDLSFAQDLRQLAADAKSLAQAELAFQKSRVAFVGSEARTIAVLLVVALVLVFFALMAFVVGLVIALGPWLTPWGAMAAVTIALLIAAGFGALSARKRMKRLTAIASGSSDPVTVSKR